MSDSPSEGDADLPERGGTSESPAGEQTPSTSEVAHLLAEIGTLLELNGRASFQARAYVAAARSLEAASVDLGALVREDRLQTVRGVGAGIAAVIREYAETGRSRLHEELRASTPPGLYDLMRVPGLGTKRIHLLYDRLGIESLDDLEKAAREGLIANLPGFGEKTQARILEGIPFARSTRQRRRYPEALEAAARLVDWLRTLPGVHDALIAGALRRRLEVVDGIDIVVATSDPSHVLATFPLLGQPAAGAGRPNEATIRLSDGLFVRVRCVEPRELAFALLWETGSAEHLEALRGLAESAGLRFDRSGLHGLEGMRVFETEEAVYQALGLAFVQPELREGSTPLRELAAGPARLVRLSDLRGVFHCHTTHSDGKASLVEMAEAARDRGWAYLGTADHSRSASYARGLTIPGLRRQKREIDAANREYRAAGLAFQIFAGVESDILADGSLDYPDADLAALDYVVGSVHGSFGMNEEEMTRRIVTAVRNPHLTILGHPTGRLLLTREGYSIDVEAVLLAAAEAGVAIEINANPHRLDLDWRHVRRAAELGILIAVNPDAHSVSALDHVVFGINMARKAGLSREQVLNTWSTEEVEAYFAQRKR